MEINKVHHLNFMDNTLPDGSVKLIIADPPYFEVKGEFDFIWDSFEDYLADVEKWAIECKRLLADNGTLFWYGHAKKIAYAQVIIDKHFNLLNNITWEKADCQTNRNEIAALRAFAPVTERILMYDKGEDKSGNERIFDDPELFTPIKEYFDEWLDKSGMTLKEAISKIGSSASHWFGFSKRPKTQFSFPTQEKWDKMEELFPNRKDYQDLKKEYEELRDQYEEMRLEYEKLRRHFELPFMISDVFHYSQESNITKNYDHDTKKPETMTRMMIMVTTKPGDLVFVPFAGSDTECSMAVKEGRDFIGFDIEEKHVKTANDRCNITKSKPSLF